MVVLMLKNLHLHPDIIEIMTSDIPSVTTYTVFAKLSEKFRHFWAVARSDVKIKPKWKEIALKVITHDSDQKYVQFDIVSHRTQRHF